MASILDSSSLEFLVVISFHEDDDPVCEHVDCFLADEMSLASVKDSLVSYVDGSEHDVEPDFLDGFDDWFKEQEDVFFLSGSLVVYLSTMKTTWQ